MTHESKPEIIFEHLNFLITDHPSLSKHRANKKKRFINYCYLWSYYALSAGFTIMTSPRVLRGLFTLRAAAPNRHFDIVLFPRNLIYI